jgi:NitT/TauT family transport system permease protein
MHRTTITLRSILVAWAMFLVIWLLASYVMRVPEYILASPGRTVSYLLDHPQQIMRAAAMTSSQALTGWLLALIGGVAVGAIVFYLPWGRHIALPPLVALQTTPIIAIAPLITYWFGYGWIARTVVAAIVASFPVVLACYSGLSEAKPAHVYLYQLCGVRTAGVFFHVRLRSAWAAILPALKVSAIFAVIGSIVAEFLGGDDGLGFMIMKSVYSARGDLLVISVVCSAIIGQCFLLVLERSVAPWEERWLG